LNKEGGVAKKELAPEVLGSTLRESEYSKDLTAL
jgi:hypothetical protein